MVSVQASCMAYTAQINQRVPDSIKSSGEILQNFACAKEKNGGEKSLKVCMCLKFFPKLSFLSIT